MRIANESDNEGFVFLAIELTNKLLDSLQLREVMLNKFSTPWTEHHRSSFAVNIVNNFLKEGAIVIIKPPQKPKAFCSLGSTLKIIKGSDEFTIAIKL